MSIIEYIIEKSPSMNQNTPARRPLFIVFDGMDGTGKTTQLHLLAHRLRRAGIPVMTTAEPTDLPDGRRLREALGGHIPATDEQMAAMFALDRIGHNQDPVHGIEKALAEGTTVLCDRYYYSSLAYQGGDDPAVFDWVAAMNLGCPAIRHPDGCLCFDLDPRVSMERIIAGRSNSQLEIYETLEQQHRIRTRFAHIRQTLAEREFILPIDAEGSREQVAERVYAAYLRICDHSGSIAGADSPEQPSQSAGANPASSGDNRGTASPQSHA